MFLAKKLNKGAGTPATTDPQFNQVTMLLHGDGTNGAQNNTFIDSSSNNFTITRNGNATQGSFSPYGSNWSNYFDGSSAYLSVPDNSAFSFGSGAFTIEAWINMADVTPSKAEWIVCQWLSDSNNSWGLRFETDGTLNFYWSLAGNDATTIGVSSPNIAANTWAHIAVVRNSNTLTIYVNGTSAASGTLSGTLYDSTTTVRIGIQANTSFNQYYTGYISNLRIVKGTAVYTSSFTPSTTPLTAITNTSLLTCQSNQFVDNSANAFTVSVGGGSPSVQRLNPFGASTSYSTSVIGGSGYFDGSGDYLRAPDNSAFTFGTGDYTVEAWIYPKDTAYNTIVNVSGVFFGLYTTNLAYYEATAGLISSSMAVPLNAWSHVAFTRSGGTLKLFVNGVVGSSTSVGTNLTGPSCYIARQDGPDFKGYISNVRIVKGTALYTSAFTPPTAPLTAVSGTSLLTSMTNGAIFDNAMMNDLETAGNAQISTSVVKYGTGSLAFDGTGDNLNTPASPNLAFSTGDFTIECWVYANDVTSLAGIYDGRGPGETPTIVIQSGTFKYFTNGGFQITSSSISTSTWYHLAVSRSGTSTKLFVNGVQGGSTYTDSTNYVSTTPSFIGALYDGSSLNGYIDDLRITKGFARYTATFTPPTSALSDTGPI